MILHILCLYGSGKITLATKYTNAIIIDIDDPNTLKAIKIYSKTPEKDVSIMNKKRY